MSKFGKELIESMREAAEHAEGRRVRGMRVTAAPDVKAIRKKLRMSQQRFASAYRIPLATVKNWEQGRRAPDAPRLRDGRRALRTRLSHSAPPPPATDDRRRVPLRFRARVTTRIVNEVKASTAWFVT